MNYLSPQTELEYLNNVHKNKIKAKNCLLKLEKDKKMGDDITTEVRNHFRLKKEITKEIKGDIVKNVRKFCWPIKKIKRWERVFRDLRNHFELELLLIILLNIKIMVINKTLSIEKDLNEIRQYL